jgi:glycogen phosphorylase
MKEKINLLIRACSGKNPENASDFEKWMAVSRWVMERLANNWDRTKKQYDKGRQAHYFSAEFLMGRSLSNHLGNLEMTEELKPILEELQMSANDVEEQENDAGLGNGGLGRLAACFLDSAATMNLPVTGYGILYRYGLFRQEIENGFQKEFPDTWREKGYPWLIRREELRIKVDYDDFSVYAVPYDMPITGYKTDNVNTLRLWKAEPAEEFDFNLFNSQRFDDAVIQRNRVNDIWRVLYPNDSSYDGKVLRVRQQYFFVSASLQDIVRTHKKIFGDNLDHFDRLHAIQLNDTHPVIGIPELMRILTEENEIPWNRAWEITRNTFAYTNHTILSEAMEKWDIGIFEFLFKKIRKIIERIDQQFREELIQKGYYQHQIDALAPIGNGKIRMAWLAIYGSFSVNGVAKLHTDIIKRSTLKEWFEIWPEKFNSKTNGVTPRRWMKIANPELSGLITRLTGHEQWLKDLSLLSELKHYADDEKVMAEFSSIKKMKKRQLSDYLFRMQGVKIDPDSLFDIQIKRLHEYKRQLMNALSILDIYFDIKETPKKKRVKRTFIFGAKAAPGYFRAKGIIKLIHEIASLVDQDPEASIYLKVVFIKNYTVSLAEKIIPAADISLQISTAGYEASGTGNMKFMMNGAVTHGTYDGANVEIAQAAGSDNIVIFGAKAEHLPDIRGYYNPVWYYENNPKIKRVLDTLVDGTLEDHHTGMFKEIYNSLLHGTSWETADVYYVLGDFDDFQKSRKMVDEWYMNSHEFVRKCWLNLCASGKFSSDRTVHEYAEEIWRVQPNSILSD